MERSSSTPDILLSDDQAESDWTKLSIPNIQSHPANRRTHHQSTHLPTRSTTTIKRTDQDALPTQLLLPEHHATSQYLGESDSSTNFDPQAWKRGDQGVGRGKSRMHEGNGATTISASNRNIPIGPQQTQMNNRSVSSSSFFFNEAAFIPPHLVPSTAITPATRTATTTVQRRRAISNSRRASRPNESTSTAQKPPDHQLIITHTRPSSDVGPSSKFSAIRGGKLRSSPPRWKAYTGRTAETSSSGSIRSTSNQKEEFLQAISNLQAMAKIGRFEWLSSNSSANDEDDLEDADEPRPGHADLPTSTFNSAVDDEDDHDEPLPPSPLPIHNEGNDDHDDHHLPFFARWCSLIGGAISLKTWQFVGLGGIIFGFGICAGSFIGRNLSSKNSLLVKFF